MEAPRCVELTDTNQPCGLTIISFLSAEDQCTRSWVCATTAWNEKLPFAGYSDELPAAAPVSGG